MNRLAISRTRELLERASGLKLLVVGDLMLDRYITGSVDRISPEAPVPVVRVEGESFALGGAGNVAANVIALGASCEVVGTVGDDPEGSLLKEHLRGIGAEVGGVVTLPGRPTTVKTRIMARHQHVTRVDREDPSDIDVGRAQEILIHIRDLLPAAQGVILEDYNKGVLVPSVIRGTLEVAAEGGIPSVVDPKRLRFFEYGGATVFKPNARELEDALGDPLGADDPVWMEKVRTRLGVQNLLITLGDRGMALQCREGGYLRVPTVARDVFDVSGAGDTVSAMMTVALAAGATPMEGAVLANHAAAVEVGKAGVGTVSPEEIIAQQELYS